MSCLAAAAAIMLLALLTWFQFPGHTWLQSDTQIYAPILEHIWNPSVLPHDLVVERPHVSFTLYDELAIVLRRITGLSFRQVLGGEQIVFRALGIWGLYLMATACGFEIPGALLIAALLSLGVMIAGPSVLTLEYEPVPRGFAVPLLLLAIGFTAQARYLAAGLAGAAAFLIHPPTVYPFWAVYLVLPLRRSRPDPMRGWLRAWPPLFLALIVLFAAARAQAQAGEGQVFFARLDAQQESLQRMRASYVFVSAWVGTLWPQYAALTAVAWLAAWRLRQKMSPDLHTMIVALPLIGLLSIPVSWLLLERMKWALMPQLQPLRSLLFLTIAALFAACAAGVEAARQRRVCESWAWFVPVVLLPISSRVFAPVTLGRAATVLMLALLACAAVMKGRPWQIAVAAALPFVAIPYFAHVRNYPDLHTPELRELCEWARASAAVDSVFLFPDADRALYPGIFRAEALRTVYVDWKGGGQVNYLRDLGEEWWRRWQATAGVPRDLTPLWKLPIHYVVLQKRNAISAEAACFANREYVMYKRP